MGKITNIRNKHPDSKAKAHLQLVHANLAGPITPESGEGFKYVLGLTDDYSLEIVIPPSQNADGDLLESKAVEQLALPGEENNQHLRYSVRSNRGTPDHYYFSSTTLWWRMQRSYSVDYCCATSDCPKTYEEAIKSQVSENVIRP